MKDLRNLISNALTRRDKNQNSKFYSKNDIVENTNVIDNLLNALQAEIQKHDPYFPNSQYWANEAIEAVVLGAALIEAEGCRLLLANIKDKEVFYNKNHQIVFEAIKNLAENNTPIDILIVTHSLRNKGLLKAIGGSFFIANLTERVNSSANIVTHIMILHELHIKRQQDKYLHNPKNDPLGISGFTDTLINDLKPNLQLEYNIL